MKDPSVARWALLLAAAVGLGAWILLAPDPSPPQPAPPAPGESQPTASAPGRAPAPPTREEVPTGTPEPAKEGRRGVLIGRILDGLGRAVADCQVVLGQVSSQELRRERVAKGPAMVVHIVIFLLSLWIIYLAVAKPF